MVCRHAYEPPALSKCAKPCREPSAKAGNCPRTKLRSSTVIASYSSVHLTGPVGALEGEHPARVLRGQLRDLVQCGQLLDTEPAARRGEVVLQLRGVLRADQDARHPGLVQQPGQCHARHRRLVRLRDRLHRVDAVEGALEVHGWKIELGAPGIFWLGAIPGVLSTQESTGKRAPWQDRQLLILCERHDLALQIAASDRVVHLQ